MFGFSKFAETLPLLFAQSGSRDWLDRLSNIDTGKLVVILIFGTGLVSAALYGVSALIRAYHNAPDESEDLAERLDKLEKRIEAVEKRNAAPGA